MTDKRPGIAVIDGQGGGMGRALVEQIKREYPGVLIRALGTNAIATAAMMKAGAHDGATGENALILNAGKMDILIGPIGIRRHTFGRGMPSFSVWPKALSSFGICAEVAPLS